MTSDIPDPEITAEPITDDGQLSTSARRMLDRIDKDHWRTEATFSRGPVITARGEWTGRIADCIAVQFSNDSGAGAAAYFLDGKYSGGFTWIWCADCGSGAFAHSMSVPAPIGYRDLLRLVSAA
jgi:hypothetical protein